MIKASDFVTSGTQKNTDFYKCVSVDLSDSQWSGRLAAFNTADNKYSYNKAAIAGLSYTSLIPLEGKTYSLNALVLSNLYQGIPEDSLVLYHPLSSSLSTLATGQQVITVGTPQYTTYQEVPCCYFDGSSYLRITDMTNIPTGSQPRTISFWLNIPSLSLTTNIIGYIGYGAGNANNKWFALNSYNSVLRLSLYGQNINIDLQNFSLNSWNNIIITYEQPVIAIYVNGLCAAVLLRTLDTESTQLAIGAIAYSVSNVQMPMTGYIAGVRIYNTALASMHLKQLAK